MSRRGRPVTLVASKQVAFRLPAALLQALDRYVVALRKHTPGLSVTRADAVRILLAKGLQQEGMAVEPQRPRRGRAAKDTELVSEGVIGR